MENKNDFPIEDRFDGTLYVCDPGKSILLPPDAARHILNAYAGQVERNMFLHATKRWGWNTPDWMKKEPGEKQTRAEKAWHNITLTPVRMVMTEQPIIPGQEERAA